MGWGVKGWGVVLVGRRTEMTKYSSSPICGATVVVVAAAAGSERDRNKAANNSKRRVGLRRLWG